MAPFRVRGEELEKTTWPNKLEYHLALFNQALGLCSFWRFPYLAFENKGAPFVYVFLLLYLLIGIPMVFLEMLWGQYSNLAPPQAYGIVPIIQGIGVSMLFLSFVVVIYFGAASYYFLLSLITSFGNPLPWSTCNHKWNSPKCQTMLDPMCVGEGAKGLTLEKGQYGIVDDNGTFTPHMLCNYTSDSTFTSPSVEYCQNVLELDTAICQDFSTLPDYLDSPAILTPVAVFGIYVAARFIIAVFGLASNVRFTGKVAYILCPLPFAIFVMLLVRCLTLEGAMSGLQYLFVPENIQDFVEPKVWKDAVSQVFLSLMISWGGLHTWSSYQRFFNKVQLDGSILVSTQPILAILSALAVFSVIGNLSYQMDVAPSEAMRGVSGPLTPIAAYMHALTQMWGDPLPWSIVIFTSLFLQTTTALFPGLECILTSLSDTFTVFRHAALRVVAVLTLLLITLAVYYGIPCLLQGSGLQIIEFVDTFALPICLLVIAIPEALIITYGFGVKLFRANVKAMTNNSCLQGIVWVVLWGGVAPITTAACFGYVIFGLIDGGISSMSPSISQQVSVMSQPMGWSRIASYTLIGVVVMTILITALIKIIKAEGTGVEKLQNTFQPVTDGRASGVGMTTASNGNRSTRTNGDLFLANYTGHHDTNEILIDEDRVTTV